MPVPSLGEVVESLADHQQQIPGVYQLRGGQTREDEPSLSVNYLSVRILYCLLQKLVKYICDRKYTLCFFL